MRAILRTYYLRWKLKHVDETAFREVAEDLTRRDLDREAYIRDVHIATPHGSRIIGCVPLVPDRHVPARRHDAPAEAKPLSQRRSS